MSLWNYETSKELSFAEMGQDTASVMPSYDYSTGLLWCASNGSSAINSFRVNGDKLETLNTYIFAGALSFWFTLKMYLCIFSFYQN